MSPCSPIDAGTIQVGKISWQQLAHAVDYSLQLRIRDEDHRLH